ncbi:MAG: hypothetical protein WBD16_13910 [Pyrinomonadaceae bacterium]
MYKSILCLILFLFLSSAVYACTCATPRGKSDKELVDSEKEGSDSVFVGRVVKIIKDRKNRGYKAIFDVSENWNGKTKRLRVSFGPYWICVISFQKGKEYLVYAGGETELTAGTCSRTKETSDSRMSVDRQYLGTPIMTNLKNKN